MSLADHLAVDVKRKTIKCATCTFYEQLSAADRATFNEWVANGRPLRQLWRSCTAEGLTIASRTFYDHFTEGHHHVTD
jgi:hypothetical protein